MNTIETQIRNANIPYPQREELKAEIAQDIAMASCEKTRLSLQSGDLEELANIHASTIYKALKAVGPFKRPIEFLAAFMPLTILTTVCFKEEKMFAFVQEGGLGMYAILLIGLLLLGRELLHIFRLVVVKDHSQHNLDLDTSDLLLPSIGLILLGIGFTFLNLYVTADTVASRVGGSDMLILGAKESITPLILSFFLLALAIFARSGTRTIMKKWKAPVPC